LLSCFLAVPSFAQGIDQSNLLFQYLTIENGLPHNKVNAVSMDKDGFMWFGTNDGICRYDGLNLKNYSLDPFSKDQLRTPQISVIKTDSKGNLLIGSYSLFRYDYLMDRIEQCDTSKQIGLMGRVYALEEAINGLIWIGSERGLFSYNVSTDKIKGYPSKDKNPLTIISLLSDNGEVWLGTRNDGLVVFDIQSETFSVNPKFSLSNDVKNQVNCLYKSDRDVIWAGTQDNGIFKFNVSDSSLQHFFPDPGNNISYRIRKIINDKNGNIWIGSRQGIFLQKAGTDSLVEVKQIDPLPSKTRSNSIYDIFIDPHEVMWVGTFSFGVGYTDFRRKPFHLYNLSDDETLFSAKMINCFADNDNESLWVGTEENGLFCFNRRTLKIKQYKPEPKNPVSLAGLNVKTIAREPNGNLWIGYYASGLDYLRIKTGYITHYKTRKNALNSIASNSIRVLLEDNEENLWIGTDKGVDLIKKDSRFIQHLNLNIEILTLYEDSFHRIWAGTSGDGIYRLKKDSLELEKVYPLYFSTSIKSILVDSQNNLWVGTNKGLYYVNSKNDSLQHFGMNNGLPSNIILDILEDDNQNLWVSTGAGLVKCEKEVMNPRNLIVRQFNVPDGLQGLQFRESASYKNSKGEFYFGGAQGFNIFDPDSIKSNPYFPKLAFTQIKIFNKNVEIGDKIRGRIVLDKAINQAKKLTLSYKHSPVSIEFAALHFSNPGNNKYRYRLSPLENEWNYSSGIRNFASYSNLQGGDYTFIVEAANCDGLWNPESLSLNIKIVPPFWKTWWFIGIVILMLSASGIGYYINRISSLQRNNAELEKKVEDRTVKLKESLLQVMDKQTFIEEQSLVLQEQKDKLMELNSTKDKFFSIIAHDLRSPFQSLLGLSEILVSEVNENVDDKYRKMAQSIYESSNRIYSLVENLLTWSRTQTNKITFEPQEINIPSIIDNLISLLKPNLVQKRLTIGKEFLSYKNGYCDKNMFEMVIRNLVTNAIKFTPFDGKINITVTENKDNLQIEVWDSGIGINNDDLKKLFRIDSGNNRKGTNGEVGTGLGLVLCKEFVEKNNGRIWVNSKVGEGSSFFFTIPIFS
jgi:ligand-binding sensor domain-containing protein/signal transduction histidine kinase